MAPGSEPATVRRIMEALEPIVYGQSLTGAGGGGYLYAISREPHSKDLVKTVLAGLEVRGCDEQT